MKIKLLEILFCILFVGFILGLFSLAELLIQVINVKTIMTAVYVALIFSFIYIFKN